MPGFPIFGPSSSNFRRRAPTFLRAHKEIKIYNSLETVRAIVDYHLEVEYFALIIGYRLATIDILLVGVSRDGIATKS